MHVASVRYLKNELAPILALGAALAVGAWLARAAVLPQVERARELSAQVSRYDSLLAVADGLPVLVSSIRDINRQLHEKLDGISFGWSDPEDLSGLLEMLIERARASDIQFVRIQPQAQKPGEGYVAHPVLLEFTCGHRPLGTFLASLESQPHVARINRLAVTARTAREMDVRVLLTMFVGSQEAPIP